MKDIRASLKAGDPEITAVSRRLGIYTNWSSFLTAVEKNDLVPTQAWVKAVATESHGYMGKMGLLNEQNRILLERLKAGAPVVRMSHQPNLFPGLNISGLSSLANQAAQATKSVVVFVSIDYDEAGDQRFRAPLLPPTNGTAPVYLHGAVPVDRRQAVAYSIEKPTLKKVRHWVDLQLCTTKHWLRLLGLTSSRKSLLKTIPFETYLARANSLTEFSLALITSHAKGVSDIDMLVVPASKLLPHLSGEINLLIQNIIAHEPSHKDKLVWRVCEHCRRRCPARLKTTADKQLVAIWRCVPCGTEVEDKLNWATTFQQSCPVFVPRIALCDAIDFQIARSRGSISYAGGLKHIFDSRMLGQKTCLASSPEFIWDPDSMNFTQKNGVSEEWNTGKFSAFVYADIFGTEKVRQEIVRSIASSEDPNHATD